MKKITILTLSLCVGLASQVFSQRILESKMVVDGELQTSHYFFIKSDVKSVKSAWKTYLSQLGTISDKKDVYTVSSISKKTISESLDKAISFAEKNDDFTTVSLVLLDAQGKSLTDEQINKDKLNAFFTDFYFDEYYKEEIRMAEEDLKKANDLLDVAKKDKGKAERSLDANLRAQEKLGKKLDQSPEEMRKLIEEKDALVQQTLGSEDATTNDSEVQALIEKKEKELAKSKSAANKNEDKLAKKESEFDDLKNKLLEAKRALDKAETVVESKKLAIQFLKKN